MSQVTLAIDYGTKRIGLAISRGSLAEPLVVIANSASKEEIVVATALKEIWQICEAEHVKQVIVGISENKMQQKTEKFVSKLKEILDRRIKIMLHDETLSSQEVRSRMKEAGLTRLKRSQPIDHFAAAVILEDWLATHDQ